MTDADNNSEIQPENFGRYRVRKKLGQGGMGQVFLASDPVLERDLAIKVISVNRDLSGQEHDEYMTRFLFEARASAKLSHPSVVTVHDVGEEDGCPWIAFEYLDGETLEERIRNEGSLPLDEACGIIRSIAEAVVHAHGQGIIHRDIKPANILFDASTGVAKLADFGIAKTPGSGLTREGTTIGSPGYMSPEQIKGLDVDFRTDIFSLGVLFYEMVAGKPPFLRETFEQTAMAIVTGSFVPLADIVMDLPPAFDFLVARALTAERDHRFQTAVEFLDVVEENMPGSDRISRVQNSDNLRDADHPDKTRIGSSYQSEEQDAAGKVTEVHHDSLPDTATEELPAGRLSSEKGFDFYNKTLFSRMIYARKSVPAIIIGSVLLVLVLFYGVSILSWKRDLKTAPVSDALIAAQKLENVGFSWSAERFLDEGHRRLDKYDLDGARELADKLMKMESSNLKGRLLMSQVFVRYGNYDDAAALIKALQIDKNGKMLLSIEVDGFLSVIEQKISQEKISDSLVTFVVDVLRSASHETVSGWLNSEKYWLRWNAVSIRKKASLTVDLVPVYILDLHYAGSWQTRKTAALKLGELGDERAVEPLRKAQKKGIKDPLVAAAARSVLEKHFSP